MKKMQKIICLFGCMVICIMLCACGRYSAPSPIEGSSYPHNYPANN